MTGKQKQLNPNSNRTARAEKRAAAPNKDLINFSDEERQQAAGKSVLIPRPLHTTSAAKKQKTDAEDAMEVEATPEISDIPPVPSDFSSDEFSSVTSSPTAPVPTAVDNSTSSVAQFGNLTASSPTIVNQSQISPLQPDITQSGQANVDPELMDDSHDFADHPSDDATISQASISYVDVAKPEESRATLLNRLKFYLTAAYPVSFKSLRCRGPVEA